MPTATKHLYEFEAFVLDPAERRLLRNGVPVPLTPKSFDLLVALVEKSGHLIEKSELLARVWPDQFVEEGSLSFNVSELRKALGDGQNGQQYIETVRKKGFRFVAPVDENVAQAAVDSPRLSRRWPLVLGALAVAVMLALALVAYVRRPGATATAAARRPRTMAVLPFKPLAMDARDEPLEVGICNSLITRLAGIDELVVRPTSSVVAYAGMGQDPLAAGRALGVDALLEGYIERSQDRIRVTARLLRASDGKSLWSGQFNENFTDIFAVEDSISRRIVEALHLSLTGEEERRVTMHATENIDAYELYLKGVYYEQKRTPDGIAKSVTYFQQATARDPRFALAFAALANSYVALAVRADIPPRDSYVNAKAAATRALEIDPANAEAHSALGNIEAFYEWDWPAAQLEFNRALQLSANNPLIDQQYAGYLLIRGRHEEAISRIQQAQRLDPLSVPMNAYTARVLYFAHQYDATIDQCRKALELEPNSGGALMFLGRAHAQKHLYPQALAELERARTLMQGSAEVLSLIGYTYAVSGHLAEARQILDELHGWTRQKYVSPYHMAMIHAGLGERDAAFQWLEKAYDDREGRLTILRFAPEFAGLRSDARFTRLMHRMKLA